VCMFPSIYKKQGSPNGGIRREGEIMSIMDTYEHEKGKIEDMPIKHGRDL